MFDFFGFTIKRKGPEEEKELLSPVPPQSDDEATIVTSSGGFVNTSFNTEFSSSDKRVLINKYRELSLMPEIESAIDEIVNEAIVTGDPESPVGVILDRLPFSEDIKEVIQDEFSAVLNLLDFNENAYEIFKRWYIDGRLFFSVVIDSKNTKDGIQELRYIDPREIEKIREVKEEFSKRGVKLQKTVQEYYFYKNDIKLPADSVAYCNSGLIDYKNKATVISYLHKSIKPYNQLRMLEDATVIYRLARAPERRVFKIGTGGLPKIKAEQYVNSLMNKFRNKIVYDQATGDLRDDSRTLSVLEDFWIPVGEDGKTTDISTLPGGQNLGEMGDVEYFRKKLYNALHVPITRISEGSTFNTGRSAEIDREEVKFNKFIKRLRVRFSSIFTDLLRTQLILKNIITTEEWDTYVKNNIYYDFRKDSHFAEYNEAEIMSRRMELASSAISLGDNYFSEDYIKKHFLKLSDEELKEMETDKESVPDEETPVEPEMDLGMSDLGNPSPEELPPLETPEISNIELPQQNPSTIINKKGKENEPRKF
jgi:hypothetical protein